MLKLYFCIDTLRSKSYDCVKRIELFQKRR